MSDCFDHECEAMDDLYEGRTFDECPTFYSGNRLCPKCGKLLIERKGEFGRFLGCSDFPKCKGTRTLR